MSDSSITLKLINRDQAWKQIKTVLFPFLRDWLPSSKNHMILEVKPATRSLDQNSKMWACLTDISKQVDWYGNKLSPDDWKHVLSASLRKQRAVPGIDGGFVVVGLSTSQMTISEMSEMIELAHAFGADKGVAFNDKA